MLLADKDLKIISQKTGIQFTELKFIYNMQQNIDTIITAGKVKEESCSKSVGKEAGKIAKSNWNKFWLKKATGITTINEAREAYDNALDGSSAEIACLVKWVELSTTLEEVKEAYDRAVKGSYVQLAAFEKIVSLYNNPLYIVK